MIRTPLSTVIGGAFWTPEATVVDGTRRTRPSFETVMKKLFSNGVQGFAYDPNDLTAEKLNWRRNLLTWTEDFSNFVWGLSNSSLTVNSITAPDGTMTADPISLIVSVED